MSNAVTSSPLPHVGPDVREITVDDISAAVAAGIADFRAAPQFGLFFGAIYAAGGLLVLWLAWYLGYLFLAYPMLAGFALIGPFVAVGLYEVSRRREKGEVLDWAGILGSVSRESGREVAWMALVSVFSFVIWMYAAGFVYAMFFGLKPVALNDLVQAVIATPRGLAFFIVGNAVGAAIALAGFSVSVVSYPLLVDRDIDFVAAMITSVRAVRTSPGPLIGWGIFIALMLAVAIVPVFLGLVVVLPVLGHASWHLYRRIVV